MRNNAHKSGITYHNVHSSGTRFSRNACPEAKGKANDSNILSILKSVQLHRTCHDASGFPLLLFSHVGSHVYSIRNPQDVNIKSSSLRCSEEGGEEGGEISTQKTQQELLPQDFHKLRVTTGMPTNVCCKFPLSSNKI